MMYRLEIENFYCFREKQALDLTVPRTVPDDPERFAPIFDGSELRAPRVVAMYGANGSGKSTVLKAITFITWFAKYSFQHTNPGLPCELFNDEESSDKPIRLAVEFGGTMELSFSTNQKNSTGSRVRSGTYRYEIELLTSGGLARSIGREILKQRPEGRGKWQRVFERVIGKKLKGSKVFPLSGYSKVIDKIRDDASVISTLALFEHEPSQVLSRAAGTTYSNILIERTEFSDGDIVRILADSPDILDKLNDELQRIDVGIKQMKIRQTANGPSAVFEHEGLHLVMPWILESHGTRSFIRMFPLLLRALSYGGFAIIDEIDISIHPLVLPEIIRWFYDSHRNPKNAQLWMTCLSASLLEDLRKEEVVLCEKDRYGRSHMYGLADIKVRQRDNFYRKYLGGAYGAIPNIG